MRMLILLFAFMATYNCASTSVTSKNGEVEHRIGDQIEYVRKVRQVFGGFGQQYEQQGYNPYQQQNSYQQYPQQFPQQQYQQQQFPQQQYQQQQYQQQYPQQYPQQYNQQFPQQQYEGSSGSGGEGHRRRGSRHRHHNH